MRGGDGADGKASSWREAADHRPRSDRTADCAASGRGGLDGGAAVVGQLGRGPASRACGAERRRGIHRPHYTQGAGCGGSQ